MRRSSRTIEPMPMRTSSPISTPPAIVAPGPMNEWAPIVVWWPMSAPRLTIVPVPTRVRAAITTPGNTTQPGSRTAVRATTADGWTTVARERPSATSRSMRARRRTDPMAGRTATSGRKAAWSPTHRIGGSWAGSASPASSPSIQATTSMPASAATSVVSSAKRPAPTRITEAPDGAIRPLTGRGRRRGSMPSSAGSAGTPGRSRRSDGGGPRRRRSRGPRQRAGRPGR